MNFVKQEVDNDWSDGEKSRSESLKSNQSGASKQSAKISSSQSSNSLFAGNPGDATLILNITGHLWIGNENYFV